MSRDSCVLFDLILYVPSTIFKLIRGGSSWVEPVLSKDKCVLLKDQNAVTPVRLEPAALRSRVKHSTTERDCCVALTHDAMGLSTVGDCGISGSYSLFLVVNPITVDNFALLFNCRLVGWIQTL